MENSMAQDFYGCLKQLIPQIKDLPCLALKGHLLLEEQLKEFRSLP
jgi:hypothetical protein